MLAERSAPTAEPPFDIETDYDELRRRQASLATACATSSPRGIDAPEGRRTTRPTPDTVRHGDRKQALVEGELDGGVEAFPGSVRGSRAARRRPQHRRRVLSANASRARAAGIGDLFEQTASTATTVIELGLPGKPAPTRSSRPPAPPRVAPARAVVVEDALAGVDAGRAGHFGLVIGVAARPSRDELRAARRRLVVARPR